MEAGASSNLLEVVADIYARAALSLSEEQRRRILHAQYLEDALEELAAAGEVLTAPRRRSLDAAPLNQAGLAISQLQRETDSDSQVLKIQTDESRHSSVCDACPESPRSEEGINDTSAKAADDIAAVPTLPEGEPMGGQQLSHPEELTMREKCGGQQAMDDTKHLSEEIGNLVSASLGAGESPWLQPPIFQGMGLKNMLAHAKTYKQRFDALCENLKDALQQKEIVEAEYYPTDVKSFESASSKVAVTYHGNCCQLTDVVRGTLSLKVKAGHDNLKTVYTALKTLVTCKAELTGGMAKFTHFHDRYHKPLGKYSDWLFLIRIVDFTCELQVNLQEAIEEKESSLHTQYEMDRLGKRKLLEACMAADEKMALLLLRAGVPVNTSDTCGLAPLHYAARHGLNSLVSALLEAGADPLALDAEGNSSLYHATAMGRKEVAQTLLRSLEQHASELSQLSRAAKQSLHRSWALATRLLEGSLDTAEQIGALTENMFASKSEQLYSIALSGDVSVLYAAMESWTDVQWDRAGGWNTMGCTFEDCRGVTASLLDFAVFSGSCAMVDLLFELRSKSRVVGSQMNFFSAGPHANAKSFRSCLRQADASYVKALACAKTHKKENMGRLKLPDCLYDALMRGNFSLAREFVRAGATLESLAADQLENLASVAGDASGAGQVEIMRIIAESGGAVDEVDPKNGYSPLHRAAFAGHEEVCRLLVEANANIDKLGRGLPIPPVACAVFSNQGRIVELLAGFRADLNAGGVRHTHSAVGQAINNNRPLMMRLLKKLGADIRDHPHRSFAREQGVDLVLAEM